MLDKDMRKVLIKHLSKESSADAITLNEVGICRTSSIVDVLHVDDKLEGYEIKSDGDSLTRLKKQVVDYSKVCDTCTIVVGHKFIHTIKDKVPKWWGIIRIDELGLEVVREPLHNETVDKGSVIELLWKEELQQLLKTHEMYRGMSAYSKRKLYRAVHENVPYGYTHDYLLERMKQRSWNGAKVR